jgi:hypothetical protein
MPEPSRYLNRRQLRAIERMGDIMIPGDSELPAFSRTEPASRVDRLVETMPEGDLGDLKVLLTVLSFFPGILLAGFLRFLEASPAFPSWLGGGLFRMIRLGMRGIVMSLYYSAEKPIETVGYSAQVYLGDLRRD